MLRFANGEKVLAWSDREGSRNETIAVRSQKLVEIKKKSLPFESQEIDWLGFDFVALGHCSLLAGGVFCLHRRLTFHDGART